MTWTKLPAVPPQLKSGCLHCGMMEEHLPLDSRIAVGFGIANLNKDGEIIWQESSELDYDQCMSVQEAETIAIADPDHDWRIEMIGPLSEREYQRQGDALWVLIRTGMGFA